MFDFERLFVCQTLSADDNGVSASGIAFAHPLDTSRLIVFGHVNIPRGIGDVAYRLLIVKLGQDDIDIVHEDGFKLIDTGRGAPRVAAAWFPVKTKLDLGYYEAVLEFPGDVSARVGFRIL